MRCSVLLLLLVTTGCATMARYPDWREGKEVAGISLVGQPDPGVVKEIEEDSSRYWGSRGFRSEALERGSDGRFTRLHVRIGTHSEHLAFEELDLRYGEDGRVVAAFASPPVIANNVNVPRQEREIGIRAGRVLGFFPGLKCVQRDDSAPDSYLVVKGPSEQRYDETEVEHLLLLRDEALLPTLFPDWEPVDAVVGRIEAAIRAGRQAASEDLARVGATAGQGAADLHARLDAVVFDTLPQRPSPQQAVRLLPTLAERLLAHRVTGPKQRWAGEKDVLDTTYSQALAKVPVSVETLTRLDAWLDRAEQALPVLAEVRARGSACRHWHDRDASVCGLEEQLLLAAAATAATPGEVAARATGLARLRALAERGALSSPTKVIVSQLRVAAAAAYEHDAIEAEKAGRPATAAALLLVAAEQAPESERATLRARAKALLVPVAEDLLPAFEGDPALLGVLNAARAAWLRTTPAGRDAGVTVSRPKGVWFGVTATAPTVSLAQKSVRKAKWVSEAVGERTVVDENREVARHEDYVEDLYGRIAAAQAEIAAADGMVGDVKWHGSGKQVRIGGYTTNSGGYVPERWVAAANPTTWQTGTGAARERKAQAYAELESAKRDMESALRHAPSGARTTLRTETVYEDRQVHEVVHRWAGRAERTITFIGPASETQVTARTDERTFDKEMSREKAEASLRSALESGAGLDLTAVLAQVVEDAMKKQPVEEQRILRALLLSGDHAAVERALIP